MSFIRSNVSNLYISKLLMLSIIMKQMLKFNNFPYILKILWYNMLARIDSIFTQVWLWDKTQYFVHMTQNMKTSDGNQLWKIGSEDSSLNIAIQ